MKNCAIFLVAFATVCANAWAQEAGDTAIVARNGEVADYYARDTYRIDSLVCPFKGDIGYEPGEIECGLLQVPENRENPDSRMIELHFVKLNSRWGREAFEDHREAHEDAAKFAEGMAKGKRDDPVFYLTGGPGAAVSYYVERFKDHTILDYRDMYILEQRGIVNSGEVCPFIHSRKPEAGDVETWEEYQETDNIARTDCAVNAAARGVDLTAYNTRENARDVKALRRALGFEDWNVWGISYGSVLGQAYIREDPEGIRAVALDAIMPLSVQGTDEYWRVVHWFMRDLDKLQALCQNQPDCARNYPDIPGRLREAVQSVIARPIEVDVRDTEVFPSGKARIFPDIAALLPFSMLYEQDNYPTLPGVIYAWSDALERRDEDLFKTVAGFIATDDGFDGSDGMYMAIVCNDGHQQAQELARARDMEEYPVFGQVLGSAESNARDTALCIELGMPLRPAGDYAPVQTDIPSLIIEGDMDPITPPPNARAILPGFSNGTYVEFAWAGHGPSRSVHCAGHMLNRFYDDPAAEPDLSCAESMEEPGMWAPMYTTGLAPRLGARFFDDRKKLIAPAAWGGGSVLVGLLCFLVLTLAPIGRWLNRSQPAAAGPTRFLTWLTATTSVAAVAILGAAGTATARASETAMLFGLVPWARYGAWLGLAAGVLGIVTLVAVLAFRRKHGMPLGIVLGFIVTAAAAISLSAFMYTWDLTPF